MLSNYKNRKIVVQHIRFSKPLAPTFIYNDNIVIDTLRNENLSLDLGKLLFYNLRDHFLRNNMLPYLTILDNLPVISKRAKQEVMKYEVIRKKLNEI